MRSSACLIREHLSSHIGVTPLSLFFHFRFVVVQNLDSRQSFMHETPCYVITTADSLPIRLDNTTPLVLQRQYGCIRDIF